MTHHTKDKGDLAVAATILDLTQKGYTVFTPAISEHCKFDLIAYKDNVCNRIQVKHSKDGHIPNKTSWNDKNGNHKMIYNLNDFDYYAIYIPGQTNIYYPNITFGGSNIRTSVPKSATPFYWHEDFVNFTDTAFKKVNYKDFGTTPPKPPRIKKEKIIKTKPIKQFKSDKRKVAWPQKEDLEIMLSQQPCTELATFFGVSDVTIKSWANFYNIKVPGRGYWAKVKAGII